MANIKAKTISNIFYKARREAARQNEQLSSRDMAAEIMSIDRGRMYRIERGLAVPYPEEVHLMADLYRAPELRNYFCTEICPLGCEMPKVEIADIDRISIQILAAVRNMGATRDILLDIVSDGVVDEEERPAMEKVVGNLETLEQVTQSLKMWVKKNLPEPDRKPAGPNW